MPRQIIDTESSRPAYVRRQILTAVLTVIVIALVLVGAYEIWQSRHAGPAQVRTTTPAAGPARAGSSPGK